jgi:flagellar hook-associated protein 2
LLTADNAGTSGSITVTNSLAASSGDATRPGLSEPVIGDVQLGTGYSGTGSVTSNAGSGYTGAEDDTYTFTVSTGGTGGSPSNDKIDISFTDGSGENTGTVQFKKNDIDGGVFIDIAEGLQIQLGAGTFTEDDTFTVDVNATPPDVQPATDASVTIGSGPGAIVVSSDSNQIEDVIPGVTLDLIAADATKTVTPGTICLTRRIQILKTL